MYSVDKASRKRRWPKILKLVLVIVILLTIVFGVYRLFFYQTVEEKIDNQVTFDGSFTTIEQELVRQKIIDQNIKVNGPVSARVVTTEEVNDFNKVFETYLPITNLYSVSQKMNREQLADMELALIEGEDSLIVNAIAESLGIDSTKIIFVNESDLANVSESTIVFVPANKLSSSNKLLWFEENYYLDSLNSGALFREVVFEGEGSSSLEELVLGEGLEKESVYKVNITGVTALTRVMMRKLDSVGNPLYFSEKIGDFLSDADLTHVSNEVSFKDNCTFSSTLFCSPPEFIETLKDSGVDLVELTGNHNNDLGSIYNTETINLYNSLGWSTVGGGLNTTEAAKPFIVDSKGSKITFLAYNFPDSPNGGAISGNEKAGANSFDFEKIEADIKTAKETSDFVVVNIQYWECYAYPDGYIEFPECDKPIGEQESVFKKVADLGANMVVGTSAHQPQTYEIYNGSLIYYGLGNLYFDQTQWPGTERGIVLTSYFISGKMVQTKLTPTVYDEALQTRIMTDQEAEYLLTRLNQAR